jgi:hypothetical protein
VAWVRRICQEVLTHYLLQTSFYGDHDSGDVSGVALSKAMLLKLSIEYDNNFVIAVKI